MHNRLFIIGHPGAGKALLAKTLADKLNWQFIDADIGLEFRIGCTLQEMLGKAGEKAFCRNQEKIISSQLKFENIVVTTDASIVIDKNILQILKNELTIYLKVSTQVQLKRISRQDTPLLTTDIESFLNKLHKERDHLFSKLATFTIDSDDSKLEKHITDVIKLITNTPDNKKLLPTKKELILFHKTLHTPVQLTLQQGKCLKLLAQGKTAKEIARDIHLSNRTVEGNIKKMCELLGCTSSKELIALYYDQP